MNRKPWPIIILSLFFLLVPFINLGFTWYFNYQQTSFSNFFISLITIPKNYLGFLTITIPSLIAAISIFSVKKWSYPVFLASMCWLFLFAIFGIEAKLEFQTLIYGIILPLAFNIAIVTYFLIPNVKATYYHPNIRWWEASPRYIVDIPTDFTLGNEKVKGHIRNISDGGLFLDSDQEISEEALIKLKFELNNEEIKLDATPIFRVSNKNSYGFQFINLSTKVQERLNFHMECLKAEGMEVTRNVDNWKDDLKNWFSKLITTGDGAIPEIPEYAKKTKTPKNKD